MVNIKDLEEVQRNLDEEYNRVSGDIDGLERALLNGEDDQRLVISLGDRYKAREEIAFEQGKNEARLEQARSLARDNQNSRDADTQEDRILSQDDHKEDQDNWWRPSQADERPEPAPEDERDDARYRR